MRRRRDCPDHCSEPNADCPEIIPDFIQVAKGYGIKGETVTERAQIKEALSRAVDSEESYILNFMIEEEENVFPMVSAGGSLKEMILRKDNKK
ncbi:MAG: thiamine pyrophosphate-dependent enzyme [Halanaerobium sp.]